MNSARHHDAGKSLQRPTRLFPLVRYLSYPTTLVLYGLPVTPNQITAVSLLFGLCGAWLFQNSGHGTQIAGAAFLIACYVLDNCDGEVARLKDMASRFGKRFDTFVDWIVHAAFFIFLGLGVAESTGQNLWLWFGVLAAVGGTINYAIDSVRDSRVRATDGDTETVETGPDDSDFDRTVFASRVIRTDFCFIVLALSLADAMWILLPAGAIGAQAYWALQFAKGFRRHHV